MSYDHGAYSQAKRAYRLACDAYNKAAVTVKRVDAVVKALEDKEKRLTELERPVNLQRLQEFKHNFAKERITVRFSYWNFEGVQSTHDEYPNMEGEIISTLSLYNFQSLLHETHYLVRVTRSPHSNIPVGISIVVPASWITVS